MVGDIDRRTLYKIINCQNSVPVQDVWVNLFQIEKDDIDIWSIARNNSSETKIIELQWKILHSIYPTGVLLEKMKIRNNDKCDFCGERDTLLHFFATCYVAKAAWGEVDELISKILKKKVVLSEKNKMIGIFNGDNFSRKESKIVNRIILISKRTISKFKYDRAGNIKTLLVNQLSFRGLLN